MVYPNIDLIQSFLLFVEEKSLARAAAKLNITQPALSMQLKRFEAEFEYPIFEFQGKSKKLTVFGHTVYLAMKDLFIHYENSFETIDRKFSSSSKQVLRVGCRREIVAMAANTLQFDGELVFYSMSSEESIKQLIDNRVDVAISRYKPDSNEIISKLFFSSHSHLVIHKKWLNDQPRSSVLSNPHKMKSIPALVYGENAELFKEWVKFLKTDFDEFNIKFRCEDWVSLLQLIENEKGFSIMPDTIKSTLPDVIHFPIEKNLVPSNPHYFLYHKSLLKFPAFKNIFSNL